MKTKGKLLYAAKEINGKEIPIFYWCKLGRNQYLVVFERIFRADPYKGVFNIISEKKFKKISEELWLQELETAPESP